MGPKADTDTHFLLYAAASLGAALMLLCAVASSAEAGRKHHASRHHAARHHNHHHQAAIVRKLPMEFSGSQYLVENWTDVTGWAEDDQFAAFTAFRTSCRSVLSQSKPAADKALGGSLRAPCHAARDASVADIPSARKFFEQHFVPLRISRLGETEGFVTGYYEPILEGSRTPSEEFSVPVLKRPANIFVRGVRQGAAMPNKGQVFRKVGRRKLVPFYTRAEIEDGALSGRGLEICYVKSQTDLLFMQIQGSARIKLEDGSTVRINYDAHNGQSYMPVGRVLIDRNIIPKEEMSMQRIRDWMEANPEEAKDVRRQNKSYVFFREVNLAADAEPVGAQGVSLLAGRSIAVDRFLHVYGTPFFIDGQLPLESEKTTQPFRRLMVAQDTGSAIIGPARADLYFGAGAEAGRVSGRFRHNARFTMLVPRSLDPAAAGRTMLLPEARPSDKIAKAIAAEQKAAEAKAKADKAKADKATDAKSKAAPHHQRKTHRRRSHR